MIEDPAHRPVWVAFPDIPWESVGWRMGGGENYWHAWCSWFKSLPEEERVAYRSSWTEPDGWHGFYEYIERGTAPPHLVERRRLVEEAAIPPADDEIEIENYYRILWLIRVHMKRERVVQPIGGEEYAAQYRAPDGSYWRLSVLKRKGMQLRRV